MLVLLPFRGALSAHCDMDEMMSMSEHHEMMADHDMSSMMSMKTTNCCDDISSDCNAACDIGITVSLVTQENQYAPVVERSTHFISISIAPLFREPNPPSRPPAKNS